MLLLSLLPIIIILVLVVLFRKSLFFSAPLTFILTLFLSLFVWKMSAGYVLASSLRGLFIAVEITLIVFGAIFFLEVMKRKGLMESIEYHLSKVSSDRRVQAILLAWMFGSFLEGAAGFGTPAAIVAPLLVAIGFPVITAVVVPLIANSASVAFGAVGTPIGLGLSGLNAANVPFYVGLTNLIVGTFVPLMIVAVLVILNSKTKKWEHIKEMIPFSLIAGLCFTVPYFILSIFSPEFPTLLGALIGLPLLIFLIKKKFLLPAHIWTFESKRKVHLKAKFGFFKSFLPYIVVVLLLVVIKFIPLKIPEYEIITGISQNLNFFNPGVLFIIVAVFFSFKYSNYIKSSFTDSFFKLEKAFLTLFFISAFVQLMANTNFNVSGLGSMVGIMSEFAKTSALPFIAPFIGALGAFIAGSATVSNLLFGKFQAQSAALLGMDTQKILALQVVGAGTGNMIALNNIVAAQATVKMHGQEERIIKINIIPCLIYLVLAGLVGMVLVYLF